MKEKQAIFLMLIMASVSWAAFGMATKDLRSERDILALQVATLMANIETLAGSCGATPTHPQTREVVMMENVK